MQFCQALFKTKQAEPLKRKENPSDRCCCCVCVQLVLPLGFERKDDKLYEEINIPPSDAAPVNIGKDRVPVDSLDEVWPFVFFFFYQKICCFFNLSICLSGVTSCPSHSSVSSEAQSAWVIPCSRGTCGERFLFLLVLSVGWKVAVHTLEFDIMNWLVDFRALRTCLLMTQVFAILMVWTLSLAKRNV